MRILLSAALCIFALCRSVAAADTAVVASCQSPATQENAAAAVTACTQLLDAETSDAKRAEILSFRGQRYADSADQDLALADFNAALSLKP